MNRIPIESIIEYQKGYAFSSSEYKERGHPIVRVKDFTLDSVCKDTEKAISQSSVEKYSKFSLKANDILIATVGSWASNPKSVVGKTVLVPDQLDGALLNQNIVRLRTKSPLSQHFLFYALKDKNFSNYIVSCAQGSANQASITLKDIFQYQILDLDPKEHFQAIKILLVIDKKIALNREKTETLECLANVLFKSWFVYFDPVRAKSEGLSTGLSDEISDLFPDSFDYSDLGEIPSGWEYTQLKDSIASIKDRQKDRVLQEFSATITGIEHRDKKFTKRLSKSSKNNKVAIEDDLVFGLSRRVINFGRMSSSIGAFSSVYEVFRSTSNSYIPTKIIERYIRVKMASFMDILKPASREGQAIDRTILLEKSIPKFPLSLIDHYQSIIKPIDQRISTTLNEIYILESIKDLLLPKLISGELRVPDAEKMLEKIGI